MLLQRNLIYTCITLVFIARINLGKPGSDQSRTERRILEDGTRINTGIYATTAKVCKTFMRRFDPGPRLQHLLNNLKEK